MFGKGLASVSTALYLDHDVISDNALRSAASLKHNKQSFSTE
jgi:hypothetical protein